MKLDPKKTAFLTLDLQKGIFGFLPDSERVMPVAAKAVAFARQNQFRIIHMGLGFSDGYRGKRNYLQSQLLVVQL